MKTKSYLLILLFCMLCSIGTMWGQSTTYTSSVTMTAGSNGTSAKVKISNAEYDAMKLGTGSATGTMSFKVPSGTTKIYLHVAGWNGDGDNRQLNISTSLGTLGSKSFGLTNDTGVKSSSPFTLNSPTDASSKYFAEISISGVTEEATITLSTSAKRAVVWGINYSAATPSTPTITPTASLSAFTATYGSASAEQTFLVGGSKLTADITVTAPANFEISKTTGTDFGSSVTLTKDGSGNVANTTLYIRLKDNIAAGTVSATNITCESTGATTQNISVSGKVQSKVNWSVNGSILNSGSQTTSVDYNGKVSTLPTAPKSSACDGSKVFVGWTDAAIASPTNTKPSTLFAEVSKAPAVNVNEVTYYAVFATNSGNSEDLIETVGFESSEGYTAQSQYQNSSYYTGTTGSKWKINYGAFATSGAIVGSQSAQFRIYNSGGGNGQLMNTVAYNSDITKVVYSAKAANTSGKVNVSYSTNGSSWTDITTQSLTTTTSEYTASVPVTGVKYIKFTAAGTKPSSGNYSIYVDAVKIYTGGTTYTDYITECITKYDVTFNMNGKTADAIAKQSLAEGENVTKPTDPTTTGYTFVAWYKESACTNAWDFANDKVGTDNIELFAKWTAITYNITYNLNDGTNAVGNPASYNIETATINLADASRDGFIFQGWFDNETFTGDAVTSIAQGSTGNKEFWAKWAEIPAVPSTVTFFDGENEITTLAATEASVGAGITLPDAPEKAGYVFRGWSTANPATAESLVAAGDDGKYHILEDTPLYAYYKVKPATPTISVEAGAIEKGTEVELSCTTDGAAIYYTTNDEDPTSASTVYSAAIVLNADQTIKAIAILDGENSEVASAAYTIAKHETKFYVNGEQLGETQSLAKGDAITFPAKNEVTGVPEDYEFMGWYDRAYTHATDAPTYVTEATMGNENVTYYAVFAQGDGLVTWNKVTDASSLVAGDIITFVSSATVDYNNPGTTTKTTGYVAISTQNTNNWKGVGVTIENNVLTTLNNVQSFTLIATSSITYPWAFCYDSKYLYAAGVTSYNYLKTSDDLVDAANFSISISNEETSVVANVSGNGARNILRVNGSYNSGSATANPVFTCYSSKTQTAVDLYKKNEGSYFNYCTSVVVREISTIAVKTAPTIVNYCEGEKFNPAGLEITVNYTEGEPESVTYAGNEAKFSFSPALDAELTSDDNQVNITYKGKSCQQTINVRTVSINAPTTTEGSYTVKVGDAEAVTADGNTIAAKKGQKIVLSSIAAEGYRPQGTPFEVKDEEDANVSISTAGGQYSFTMPDKDVTITAKFSKLYTLTAATTIANGSIAIKDKDNNVITEHVNNGKVVVVVTSAPHYTLSSLYYVKEGLDAVEEANRVAITQDNDVYTFMMPQSNVTIYATFTEDEKHDAIFYVNGSESSRATTYTGEKVVFPTTKPEAPSTCAEKVFVGWTETSEYDDEKNAPTYVSDYTMANADKIFYAVFAEEVGDPTSFIKGSVSNLGTGIKVLLVHNDKAVSSSASKDNYLGAGNVTINNSKINCSDESLIWTVTKNESTYKFDQGASKILNVNASGLYANTTDGSFVISVKNSSYELKDANVTAYIDYWGADGFSKLTISHNDNTIDFYVPDVTYVNYSTICAECQNAIMITKGAETNGTFTLSKEGEVCLDKKPEGYSVTVKATPAEHYHLASVTTTSGEAGEIADNQCVVSGITANTTITAVFAEDAKYTVNWEVNGLVVKTENLYADVAVSAPAVEAINDKVFRGWVAEKIEGTIANAADVDFVDVADKTISNLGVSEEETTYYAVFATKSAGADASVEFSVSSITSILQTIAERKQTTDDGITFTFSLVGAAGTGNATVQMSKNSTLTQDVAFAGNIKSIAFEDFAYSSTKDASMLVEGKKGADGTYGTVQSCGSTYNGSDISFNGKNYDFFKITVGSERTVKFTKMTVSYEGVGYSDFCTSIITFTHAGTINFVANTGDGHYYATFSSDQITAFPAEPSDDVLLYVEAVYVNGDGTITKMDFGNDFSSVNDDMDKVIIPANTGVLLHAFTTSSEAPSVSYEYTNAESEVSEYSPEFNMLVATPSTGIYNASSDDNYYYKLAYGDNTNKTKLGFWWGAADGSGNFNVKAGGAILRVPQTVGIALRGFSFSDLLNPSNPPIATGVDDVRMNVARKVFVDGKLYIVRESKLFDVNGRLVK